MKIDNLDFFEKEVSVTLQRMNIEDINNTCKLILEWTDELEKENLERVLMKQLRDLLGESTNEMVEVICNHLGVRRHYESEHDVDKYADESKMLSGRLGYKLSSLRIRHGKSLKKIRSKMIKERKLRWSDLAGCTQGRNGQKLDMPCADLMGTGVCMNVDNCRFSHKHGAVIKSKVTKFNSSYNTPKDKVDYRTCILPEQSGYYDRMTVLPGAGHEDAISISSTENDAHVDLLSPPCIYEPPTMLDSPLWYQEMGLVEEISDSESSSCQTRRKVYRHRSLLLSNIPPLLNRIGVINKYFRKFGALRNIEVNFKGDSTKAVVEFRLSRDMLTANKSVEAVMGNRFIKTQPYKIKKRKKYSRRHKRRSPSFSCRSGRRSHSSSHRRRKRSRSSGCRSHNSRGINYTSRDRDFKQKLKYMKKDSSGSTIRKGSSSEKSDCYYKSRRQDHSNESGESCEDFNRRGQTDYAEITQEIPHDTIGIVKSVVVSCKQEVRTERAMEVDGALIKEILVPEERYSEEVRDEARASMAKMLTRERGAADLGPGSTADVMTVIRPSSVDEDVKLEKALNDSDVDSVHSDDSFCRMKRQVVMSCRRKQLQEDNWRNNLKKKMERTTSSLNYYKSILETLIIEYRRNDKPGKARIIPKIKETHAKYMEIKTLYATLLKSLETDKHRKSDPVEGQISNLESSIEVKLSMSPRREQESCNVYVDVPSNIVLDPLQIQAHLGDNLKIENMEKLQSSNKGTCYVITLQSPASAATALNFLSTNNPMNWHIATKPPDCVV